MKVFKFGGASVKDADGVRNVARVLQMFSHDSICVVLSAMGKTTNAMEVLVEKYVARDPSVRDNLNEIREFHENIINDLFPEGHEGLAGIVQSVYDSIRIALEEEEITDFDFEYDQLVGWGEILATQILSAYLTEVGLENQWFDARMFIRTGTKYRDAQVNFEETNRLLSTTLGPYFDTQDGKQVLAVTQGFIAQSDEGTYTTLGREGSDFTGSIIAHLMEAESLTVWKDVPGVLSADPKYFPDAGLLPHISYREAIELSYYGATVIHPKTIKPLENKKIPLYVRSFVNPEGEGTRIDESWEDDRNHASFIVKRKQVLLSVTPHDFSFIVERNLSDIFETFARNKVKISLIQNSAINFSACASTDRDRVLEVITDLQRRYKVKYNDNVELLTIRHYTQPIIDELTNDKEVLVEQRTRETARFVLR